MISFAILANPKTKKDIQTMVLGDPFISDYPFKTLARGDGKYDANGGYTYEFAKKQCCDENAATFSAGIEASVVVSIGAETGTAYGWSKWLDDGTCVWNFAHFNAHCIGFGADIGVDGKMASGHFYNYDSIPGSSIYVSGGVAIILALGGGAIYAETEDDRGEPIKGDQIGSIFEVGIGMGVEGSWGRCFTNTGSKREDRISLIHELKNDCPAKDSGGLCFPGDAMVSTPKGSKMMRDLRVGDAVLTMDADGRTVYEDVYMFGHAQSSVNERFVQFGFGTEEPLKLEISEDHFLPTCAVQSQPCAWEERVHKYARHVQTGDYVWAAPDSNQPNLVRIMSVAYVVNEGLYNPYTLSGNIVVNGVVASSHSSWVLDPLTPKSLVQYLPSMYQMLFAPGRLLYWLAGPKAADFLDMNNPQANPETFGYGPTFLGTIASTVVISSVAMGFSLAHKKGANKV